jgi:hypothetical protein
MTGRALLFEQLFAVERGGLGGLGVGEARRDENKKGRDAADSSAHFSPLGRSVATISGFKLGS